MYIMKPARGIIMGTSAKHGTSTRERGKERKIKNKMAANGARDMK
jgi:hypothetical protein